jgi:5-hydroxyisourate hydrolase
MPGISVHVVDVASGSLAQGLRVELHSVGVSRRLIASGTISPRGLLEDASLAQTFAPGFYEAVLHVGEFYSLRSSQAANQSVISNSESVVPFLEVVTYRFGIADPAQHYHLPFKMTAWGYSCFRGGA